MGTRSPPSKKKGRGEGIDSKEPESGPRCDPVTLLSPHAIGKKKRGEKEGRGGEGKKGGTAKIVLRFSPFLLSPGPPVISKEKKKEKKKKKREKKNGGGGKEEIGFFSRLRDAPPVSIALLTLHRERGDEELGIAPSL